MVCIKKKKKACKDKDKEEEKRMEKLSSPSAYNFSHTQCSHNVGDTQTAYPSNSPEERQDLERTSAELKRHSKFDKRTDHIRYFFFF